MITPSDMSYPQMMQRLDNDQYLFPYLPGDGGNQRNQAGADR